MRIDIPVVFNDPTENPKFNEYAAQQGFGVRVGENPSAKVLFSPRVGFRWYTNDSHKTLIRGGVGIFTGRVPFVWLSNAFTNTGMESKGTTLGKVKGENGSKKLLHSENTLKIRWELLTQPMEL